MNITTASTIGPALCKAFGLDGRNVVGITIRVTAGEAVEVDVTRYVGVDEMNQAISEFTPYKLSPRD